MRELRRLSVSDPAALLDLFSQGPAEPLLITDASAHWPALEKWSLDYFAREYGTQFGMVQGSFGGDGSGKATTLGQFIAGMDAPLSATGGFWVDENLRPAAPSRDEDALAVWSFCWRSFDASPELRADISPYPAAIPNTVPGLDWDIYRLLEKLSGYEFNSIYVSRKGTVTPLHGDFGHTYGSLVQFAGEKLVFIYDPAEAGDGELKAFNPEAPDFAAFPHMRGAEPWQVVLQRGELVIFPPNFLHYTRALDHSITLSHNFFNQFNFSAYLREQLETMVRKGRTEEMCAALAKLAAADPAEAPA